VITLVRSRGDSCDVAYPVSPGRNSETYTAAGPSETVGKIG